MDFRKVHHLREVLVQDWRGNAVSTMHFSYDNAEYLQPHFIEVGSGDQAKAREIYYELGGSRAAETAIGKTVTIPNRGWSWRDLF
jgi:hypothetical protein